MGLFGSLIDIADSAIKNLHNMSEEMVLQAKINRLESLERCEELKLELEQLEAKRQEAASTNQD